MAMQGVVNRHSNVHEALDQNDLLHDLFAGSSGSTVWPYSENVFNLKKNLFFPQVFDIDKFVYLIINCEMHGTIQVVGRGQYDHVVKMYLIL